VPVRHPGQPAEADATAGFRHAGEAEVEAVGQDPGHHQLAVLGGFPGPQMGEAIGEAGPPVHLGQQIGDPHPGQHGVQALVHGLRFRRPGLGDGSDLQRALDHRNIDQRVGADLAVDPGEAPVEAVPALGKKTLHIGVDRQRQGALALDMVHRLGRDQMLLERPVSSAADHPDIAGPQPIAQFGENAQLIVSPVEVSVGPAAGEHMACPALLDEGGRRGLRQGVRARCVGVPQNLDGPHQRLRRRDGLELEGGQKGRRPATDAGVALPEGLVEVEILRPGEIGRLRDGGDEPFPGQHRIDGGEGIVTARLAGDQGLADPAVQADLFMDGASIPGKGPGVPLLRGSQQRADQPFEDVQRLISEAGGQVEDRGD
jgi:hypothetical protein